MKLEMSGGGKHGKAVYVNVEDPRETNIAYILMNNWGPTFLNNRTLRHFTDYDIKTNKLMLML